jgi:RNA polymerase sigma-70 factor (ECF subfamily)
MITGFFYIHLQDMEARIEKYHNLFVTHYGDLCNYASLFIPRHDAEDVVCDLFTGLLESKNPSEISRSYLYTSVKNRCLNRIRNAQSDKAYQDYIAERLSEYFETPDESLFMDVKEQLCKAIQDLPERYRQVFILSRFSGLSNKEIAQQTGLTVRTVESYVTSALKILRTVLKDYLFFLLMII